MDIKDISFFKPENFFGVVPENCSVLYGTTDSFMLFIDKNSNLYVCTSACIVKLENSFSKMGQVGIYSLNNFDPLQCVCYYTNKSNIKIFCSSSDNILLQVGCAYIVFNFVKYGFFKAMIEKVRAFVEKK